jgi:hypothetical protein
LSDPETITGREMLRERIRGKRGIFPQGIFPDKKYRLLYEFGRKYGFGKSSLLRCPYYIQGKYNCALWKYRESICATWFCKYAAGEAGKIFWDDMRDLFKLIQEKLTEQAIRDLGLPFILPYGDDEHLAVEDLDDLPLNPAEYRRRWQQWEGREEEFYIRCYEIVCQMEVSLFNRLLGEEFSGQSHILEEKYLNMTTLPDHLEINPAIDLEEVIPGYCRLRLKSYIERNDTVITFAFDVPKSVIDGFREGKITERVFEDLEYEKGIQLGKDLVVSLFQHGILIREGTD